MAGSRGALKRTAPAVGLALALAVAVVAAVGALSSLGRPIPSLFVDPYGDFSVVYLPSWGTEKLDLRLADHWIDGPARAPGGQASALEQATSQAAAQGDEMIDLRFSRAGVVRTVHTRIRPIETADLWWFHGVYAIAGLLILWFGGAGYALSDRRAGAVANLCLSISAFVFLTTFFDYHTTRWLAPLFAASTLLNPLCLCAVALSFPEPLSLSRRMQLAVRVVALLGALAVLALALDALFFFDLRPLRLFVNVAASGGLLVLAVVTAIRLRAARGPRRRQIVSAAWGMSLSPAFLSVAFAVSSWWGLGFFHLVLPLGVTLFPVAVAYALLQHNILETRDILTRRLFAFPAALLGLAAGGSTYIGLHASNAQLPRVVSGLYALLVAAGTTLTVWTLVLRFAFGATRRYRPSVERLRDRLARETDAPTLERALVDITQTWLDVDGVTLLRPGAELSPEGPLWNALETGESTSREERGELVLYKALRLRGRTLGALRIPRKRTGAPFTTADLEVLDTLASLGSLGLQHIATVRELEELRQIESRVPMQAVDLLAAEMAHEVQHPLSYFRYLMEQLGKDRRPEQAEVEIGCEEVARLERMVEDLKRLQLPSYDLAPHPLHGVARRAVALLRRLAELRAVTVSMDVPPDIQVVTHPDPLVQLLQNLVKNAILAAPQGGIVEVRARAGDEVILEVRDNGAGVPAELATRMFEPWVTTRSDGTGLGLAVAQRTVRQFGWTLEHERVPEGWTVFRIRCPRAIGPAEV